MTLLSESLRSCFRNLGINQDNAFPHIEPLGTGDCQRTSCNRGKTQFVKSARRLRPDSESADEVVPEAKSVILTSLF